MNTKFKNVILHISFIPYLYLIISSFYYAIFGYTYSYACAKTIYGIDAIFDNIINRFWFDNFIMFNFIGFLCVCCIIYQIWYFIDIMNRKEILKVRLNIKKILLIISLVSWVIYFLSGIYAIFGGYQTGIFYHTTIYGLKAFKEAMLWNLIAFTFIPILPITLIYIIIYSVIKIRERKTIGKFS